MVFTESRIINGKKYYYRVLSIRKGKKISKKSLYLGKELPKSELEQKEIDADKKLLSRRSDKTNKEIESIKSKIIPILKKNKVIKAGIFGSYARGEQKKDSDVDILVEINNPKLSLFGIIGIENELSDKLKKKVDLVEYVALHRLLKERILNDEVRII